MEQFKVVVSCITYNHSKYIEEAFNGFCMQNTDFPFLCTIVDDCSTDGEQGVIINYLKTHFEFNGAQEKETKDYKSIFVRHKTNTNCFFGVFLLKYNHTQIKKPKKQYIELFDKTAKYVALCEGDDYWIDEKKLQKQVSFLDSHPDYTMVCNRIKTYSEKEKAFKTEQYCYKKSREIDFKDIVYRTGLFIPTCSIVYRPEVRNNYPDYCARCKVGDYPLQIMCGIKGKTYYFDDLMSVYRVGNSNSWMGKQKFGTYSQQRIEVIKSMIDMFKGFRNDYPHFKSIFDNKIANYINRGIPMRSKDKEGQQKYLRFFKKDFDSMSFFWKIDAFIRSSFIFIDGRPYEKTFFRHHSVKRKKL